MQVVIKKRKRRRKQFVFTLWLMNVARLEDGDFERLSNAGCDDATVAEATSGVYLTFHRKALNMSSAIQMASSQVRKAMGEKCEPTYIG